MSTSPNTIEGRRYGRYTVLGAFNRVGSNRKFLCKCECGTTRSVYEANLVSGKTLSCGCFHSENTISRRTVHGESGTVGLERTPEYRCWIGMRARCSDKEDKYYGGRGISVCKRWEESFMEFLGDMGRRPSGKHSIDRINNDGDYEPNNCRWATAHEQRSNTSRNVLVVLDGQKMIVAEALRKVGLKSSTFWERVRRGWSMQRAISVGVKN